MPVSPPASSTHSPRRRHRERPFRPGHPPHSDLSDPEPGAHDLRNRLPHPAGMVGVGVSTTFTPFFASQFFHSDDAVSDVLKTLVVFAVGFFARPFGGLLFGWIADRKGRKL